MFLTNKLKPTHNPPGCNPLRDEDRMPVLKVVSGDTWVVDAELYAADGGPASPKNSHVEFVLAENQFSPPLWTGTWINGVLPDRNRPGLVHVRIPRDVTKALRRGSYMFSMRVSDLMKFAFDTQLKGNFLVEYMPTSDQHSIPYRDGTSEKFGGTVSESIGGSESSKPDSSGSEGIDSETLEEINKAISTLKAEVSLLKHGKANKDEMTVTPGTDENAGTATIQLKDGTEVTVITEHQDVSGKVDKDALAGNTYDFSTNRDIIRAGADVAEALGAGVDNDPTDEVGE